MEQQEINKMIAFFHTTEPVSCQWEDTWTEEEDSRTIIFVEYPEGKFVIKAAANDFTTIERVAGWVEMINNFREMGYYCPMLRKSQGGNYAEVLDYCKEYTDAQFERYLEGLRKFREYYEFTEEEADAAMPLYRYIMTIGYDEIEVVKKYADDDDKMNQMFDWIEAELTRNDIDFRSAMLK